MSEEPAVYDASHITVLEGLQAVRKRPGMYIGSTDERGLHQLVLEAAGWGIDEILVGRASRVEVTLLSDGGVRVADDGPGVLFGDGRAGVGGSALTSALTLLTTGSSTVGPRYPMQSLMGQLSIVNALSSRLVAEARSEGRREVQEYVRSVLVAPVVRVAPVGDPGSAGGSGTTITFWPDADIFATTEFSFAVLTERFRELAFLYPELDFTLTDERKPSDPRSLRLHFPSGVREMVAFLDGDEQAPERDQSDVIGFELDDPQMAGMMEIAWRWRDSGPARVRGFANARHTPEGGTHALGFHDGVAAALTAYARQLRLLAPTDPDIGADRIREGLTAAVSVKLEHPSFTGCTRGVLGNVEVRGHVRQAVQEHLGRWLAEHPRQAAEILARII